jgi:soluble lytic murein transglycosylase-like protein
VERESNWRSCAISPKGAAGLMQLMPSTAERLGVRNCCNVDQNVSGGVRYLAWLTQRFHGDFRLALAAYYAGEDIVARRGLAYRNPDVVSYVSQIRATYLRISQAQTSISQLAENRNPR